MNAPWPPAVNELRTTVQHNCAISDARYARDYSMCVYLLRMREFYRWRQAIPPGATIDASALGDFVSDTENWWDTIEETDFRPLTINSTSYDPFDVAAINSALNSTEHFHGCALYYGAGVGRLGQPHFVLARLQPASAFTAAAIATNCADASLISCIECGCELARDTMTLPAMSQNGTIIIRHDSILRMLWQMVDEWKLRKPPGPMSRLVEHFGLTDNNTGQLKAAATELSKLLLHHELGELKATGLLGSGYSEMTSKLQGYRSEAYVRAVRDLVADSVSSWPFILKEKSLHHLDFWLAGLAGVREELFKHSSLCELLIQGSGEERLAALEQALDTEQLRWQHTSIRLLNAYQHSGRKFNAEQIITNSLSQSSNTLT